MVTTAPIGSTIPDKVPNRKALPLLFPSLFKGMEMMAPSGKFWMAIPMASANAPAAVMLPSPVSIPANTTPTAIPSGMLWRVTASTSMVVLLRELLIPSGSSWSR